MQLNRLYPRYTLGALLLFLFGVGCAASQSSVGPATPQELQASLEGIHFIDSDGQKKNVADFHGKVLLLDFWATWCAPCEQSLSVYGAWHGEYESQGLAVVTVSVDENDVDPTNFLKKHGPGLALYRDSDGKAAEALNLPTMPTAFIINRQGRLVIRHTGFVAEDEAILKKQLLGLLAEKP